jgi:nitroreductase
VLRGGGGVPRTARPRADGASEEDHAAWARDYADRILGTYRRVPVWICAVIVPRFRHPDDPAMERVERFSDVTSLAFALENLFVAARAMGLGTTPTNFHFFVEDEYWALLGLAPELGIHYLTPLGYPPDFPVGLWPSAARARRPWRTLVHDECWGHPREEDAGG